MVFMKTISQCKALLILAKAGFKERGINPNGKILIEKQVGAFVYTGEVSSSGKMNGIDIQTFINECRI